MKPHEVAMAKSRGILVEPEVSEEVMIALKWFFDTLKLRDKNDYGVSDLSIRNFHEILEYEDCILEKGFLLKMCFSFDERYQEFQRFRYSQMIKQNKAGH